MYLKLVFLGTAVLLWFGCGNNDVSSPPVKLAVVQPAPGLPPEEQNRLTVLFDKSMHGQWVQSCQPFENSSAKVFIKFDSENHGNQKTVTYNDTACSGEVSDYKVRPFTYQLTDMNDNGVGVNYGLIIQFVDPQENQPSSLNTTFQINGSEVSYRIKNYLFRKDGVDLEKQGSNSFINLEIFQNTLDEAPTEEP